MFKEPEVIETKDLKIEWGKPDVEGLKEFLVKEKNFSEGRIENAMKRLANAKSKANQSRLDNFFKPISVSQTSIKPGSKKLPEPIKTGNKKGKTTRKKK